jgi:hypothetical protein
VGPECLIYILHPVTFAGRRISVAAPPGLLQILWAVTTVSAQHALSRSRAYIYIYIYIWPRAGVEELRAAVKEEPGEGGSTTKQERESLPGVAGGLALACAVLGVLVKASPVAIIPTVVLIPGAFLFYVFLHACSAAKYARGWSPDRRARSSMRALPLDGYQRRACWLGGRQKHG